MKEDGKYLMKQSRRLMAMGVEALMVHLRAHYALLIMKMYTKLLKACINKPKLFVYFLKQCGVWATRCDHWQTRFEEIKPEADEIMNDIDRIRTFYNL